MLLKSKDLNECYDYETNDKSYKLLYDCLSVKEYLSKIRKDDESEKHLSPKASSRSPRASFLATGNLLKTLNVNSTKSKIGFGR